MPAQHGAADRPTWRAVWLLSVAGIVVACMTLAVHWSAGESLGDDTLQAATTRVTIDEPPPAAPGGPVAVLGDSIVYVSTPMLREYLAPPSVPDIDGDVGATVSAMTSEAERMARARPRQAIIDLGTNDIILGGALSRSMEEYRDVVDTFLDAGVECVHVVNLSTSMQKLGAQLNDQAEQFNEFLDALAERPDIEVIDWAGMVVLAQEDPDAVVLTTDTVHPTPDGSRALGWLMHNALDEGCA